MDDAPGLANFTQRVWAQQPAGLDTFATQAASPASKRLALAVCGLVAILSLALLPIARMPLAPIPGFLALTQGALILIYGVTTWLFLAEYSRTGSVSLLVLGAGSLFTLLIVIAQLVCLPNILAPGVLLGRGPATATWLWTVWHVGPPLFALPYAIMEGGVPRYTPRQHVAGALWGSIAAVCVGVVAITVAVTQYVEYLPTTAEADGGYRSLTTSGIGPALLLLTAASLALLCWTTRLRRMLQLWLAVSLVLLILDNILTDAAAFRGAVGWVAGRVEALLAAILVLAVYLREVEALYHRAEETAFAQARARTEAHAARANLEIVLEASGMGDWELDLLTDTSRRTFRHDRLFGYTELQPVWGLEQMVRHILPADRPIALAAMEAAKRGGRLEFECRIRRADDAVRWIAVWGRTYFDEAGQAVAMAGCLMDTTKRRETEERLRQVERMEAIGQLTGGMAHDFNNMLTVILGSLDLIARRPDDAARVERLARNAFIAGQRGTELTEKLLSFSRRQVLQVETVNPNRLLGEFVPLLQRCVGDGVIVTLDLAPELDPTRIDPAQFQSALLNLAANARDAMPNGGALHVETRNIVIGAEDAVAGLAAGEYLRVRVRDTGVGMDATTAGRAIEPFFTTKEVGQGTGLGLSQVYGFVQQAGGGCEIESTPGDGSTITLYLPRAAEISEPSAPDNVVPLRRATGGEVVLVVEDDEIVRDMAEESLQALGYCVMAASDARIALDLLRDPGRIDILFSDVVMPGGMNGAQLASEARRLRPSLKVLLTSGYTATATAGSRELPQDVQLLRKPYLRADLAAKLQNVLQA